MKHYLKVFFSLSILVLLLSLLPQLAMAQPGDPGGDVDLPVDGGIGLLLAAGVVYGVKKIRDERKRKLNKLP